MNDRVPVFRVPVKNLRRRSARKKALSNVRTIFPKKFRRLGPSLPPPQPFHLVTRADKDYRAAVMNWVFVSPIKGPVWGGMANWFRNLGVGFQERGDRCVVIGRPDSRWPEVCRATGMAFEPFRFPGDLAFWEMSRLAAMLRRHRPDAGIVKGFRQARFLRYAQPSLAVAVKLPFVYDLTDSPVDRATCRFAVDRILVDSYRTRRAFLDFPWMQEDKVVAVHNGVASPLDEEERLRRRAAVRARLGVPADRLVVAYCGRFTQLKRPNEVLDAFLRAGLPGRAECWMLGEGPFQAELEAQAARPEFTGAVRFVGWVDQPREWLPACDILIHPSSAEGLPNAVLEGMACGVSVIATRAGGTEEIIRDGEHGFLTAIGDGPGLAARLSELAADAGRRARFSVAARERMRTGFTLQNMVEQVRTALREAADWRAARHATPIADSAGWTQWRHPNFHPAADWTALPQASAGRLLQDTPRFRVVQAAYGEQTVCAKQFYPAGRGHGLRLGEGADPAHVLRAVRTAGRLALRGVSVAPPLAAGWRKADGTAAESLLLIGVPSTAVSVEERLARHSDPASRRRFAAAAGWWLGRLHAAGLTPPDLAACRVQVESAETARYGIRFYLLDVEDGEGWGPVTGRAAARNLRRLHGLFENRLGRAEQRRFLAAYRRSRKLARSAWRRLLSLAGAS